MILIEGISILAARLTAEQNAKEWVARTRRWASDSRTQSASTDGALAAIQPSTKVA